MAKQLHLVNGTIHPPNQPVTQPNCNQQPNQIKYPQKAAVPQLRNQQNTTLVAPQPS